MDCAVLDVREGSISADFINNVSVITSQYNTSKGTINYIIMLSKISFHRIGPVNHDRRLGSL